LFAFLIATIHWWFSHRVDDSRVSAYKNETIAKLLASEYLETNSFTHLLI